MAEVKKTTKAVKEVEKKVAPKATPKSAKFAVIKTGGKQYLVEEGRFYEFEKLEVEEGKPVVFEEVLLISDAGTVKIGEPTLKDSKVTGKMLEQFKDDKVTVLKYKPKKRYRKTTGHRQRKSKVMIEKIA